MLLSAEKLHGDPMMTHRLMDNSPPIPPIPSEPPIPNYPGMANMRPPPPPPFPPQPPPSLPPMDPMEYAKLVSKWRYGDKLAVLPPWPPSPSPPPDPYETHIAQPPPPEPISPPPAAPAAPVHLGGRPPLPWIASYVDETSEDVLAKRALPYDEGHTDEFMSPPPFPPPPRGMQAPLYVQLKEVLLEWSLAAQNVRKRREDPQQDGLCTEHEIMKAAARHQADVAARYPVKEHRTRVAKVKITKEQHLHNVEMQHKLSGRNGKLHISVIRDPDAICAKDEEGVLCKYYKNECAHLKPGTDEWCALRTGGEVAPKLAEMGAAVMVQQLVGGQHEEQKECTSYFHRVWDEAKRRASLLPGAQSAMNRAQLRAKALARTLRKEEQPSRRPEFKGRRRSLLRGA